MRQLTDIRSVLFDLDGTLVDSRGTILASVAHAVEALGLDPDTAPDVGALIGMPLLDIFTGPFGMPHELAHRAIDLYRDYYDALNQEGTTVYEGVRDGLAALGDTGYGLYIATVKPTPIATKVLADLGLIKHFDGVAGASMGPERRDKTRIIAHAVSEFGLEPGHCMMVGDRDQDIEGARANGMMSVAVSWGFGHADELSAADPDHSAGDFHEIPHLLAGTG